MSSENEKTIVMTDSQRRRAQRNQIIRARYAQLQGGITAISDAIAAEMNCSRMTVYNVLTGKKSSKAKA